MKMKKLLILTSNEIVGTINNDKLFLRQDLGLEVLKNFPEECAGPSGTVTKLADDSNNYSYTMYEENGNMLRAGMIEYISLEDTEEDNNEWNKESIEDWPDAFTLLIDRQIADTFVPIISKYGLLTVNILFSKEKLGRPDREEELCTAGICQLKK